MGHGASALVRRSRCCLAARAGSRWAPASSAAEVPSWLRLPDPARRNWSEGMHRLGGSGGSSPSDGSCADPAPMMSPLLGGRPEPDGIETSGISLCGAYAAICSSNADWLANSGKKAPSDAGSKPGVVHDAGCSSTSHYCWPPSILVNKNNVLNISYKSCHGMCKTNTSLLVCSPFVRRMLVRETVACKCSVLK